ncbi:uncharacterized protein TRIADDRAFT_11108, partial [Trichoplax adhaerens]
RIHRLSWLSTCIILVIGIVSTTNAAIGRMVKDGDVIIGGLFPVHIENQLSHTLCNETTEKGAIWVKAMMYAIDSINNNTELLPTVTLGYDIRDTCHNLQRAIKASMDYVVDPDLDISVASYLNSSDGTLLSQVAAVVGASSSHISMAVVDILRVYCLPVISYSSTSRLLSNKIRYSSFLRTVPSDVQQARAIAQLIRYFNWTYVSTIAVDTAYGRQGIQLFHEAAAALGICTSPVSEIFSASNPKSELPRIIQKLKQQSNATVIVFYSDEYNAMLLLNEADKQNLVGRTWIASESWGDSSYITRMPPGVIGGMLGVVPQTTSMDYFKNYLKQFAPPNPIADPWFYQYLYDRYNTKIESNGDKLNRNELIKFEVDDLPMGKSQNVINAVYAIAHGLDKLLRHDGNQHLQQPIDPSRLLAFINNQTFIDQAKNVVQFDDHGDPVPNFVVVNLQPDRQPFGRMKYKIVGHWQLVNNKSSEMELVMKDDDIIWNGWTHNLPISTCSEQCSPGQEVVYLTWKSSCCWRCRRCSTGFISNTTDATSCQKCQLGFKTNLNRTKCLQLPIEFLNWNNAVAITIITLANVGIAINFLFLGILIWNRNHKVIQATSKGYLFVVWILVNAGFLLCYLYIGEPTDVLCTIQPIYFGLNYTIVLLVITLREMTLMFKGYQEEKIASTYLIRYFQSWGFRYFFSFAILCGQVTILGIWMFTSPQTSVKNYKHSDRILSGCSREFDSSFPATTSIVYVIMICLFTTYISFKVRHLPYCNYEGKYINFCLLCILLGWIAFIPSYLATAGIGHVSLICFSVIINSNCVQWFIIYPSVYQIVIRP